MGFEEQVESLVNEGLETREDLFLISLKISVDSQIQVVIDGDHGIQIDDCLQVSRYVESRLDREAHDFSLQVMSAGLSEPLKLTRQYHKNLGRGLDIFFKNETKLTGTLKEVDENQIVLTVKYRRKKLIGKGKENVTEDKKIPFSDIKKALVVLKF